MDSASVTLIGLAAFLTQFQRFLLHVGVGTLSFNQGGALAEARGDSRGRSLSFLCNAGVWTTSAFPDLFLTRIKISGVVFLALAGNVVLPWKSPSQH